ncbi:MAG: NAD-dependent epimerase/dehydratase family protein [Treponema sp.]|nr:NAD-dependent epimerase/dehydratase family protein [Treponema sp.]
MNLRGGGGLWYHFKWYLGSAASDINAQVDSIKVALDALEHSYKIGCKRFIFAGSIMEHEVWKLSWQDGAALRARDGYAAAKYCASVMLKSRAQELGVEFINAVITNVYGPGDKKTRFIAANLAKIKYGEAKTIPLRFSAGTQMYDFIYIDDAARAFADIGEKGFAGRNYNVGSGGAKPLRLFLEELLDEFSAELSGAPGASFGAALSGVELPLEAFSAALLQADTGFAARISFREGLRKTYEAL